MSEKRNIFSDLLREEAGGKYSSKKIWGTIIMILVCTSFILDGTNIYKANEELFNSMLIAGTALLGLSIVKGLGKKKTLSDSNEKQY